MAKPNESEADDKSEGLEIISIGSLYSGAWDKKYWSSSRGKDRYPYPVGYHARRAYNGSSYNMEILEGSKGPLFVISCGDGNSCSAQTPDIAWEKFQKKGFSKMSIWHGKRFSCKIDGIEFFGFKNQFVQRLLRELVANINGIAECSSLPSRFCNGASATGRDDYHEDASVHPDLLPYSARVGSTRKSSKRRQASNPKSINIVSSKRLRPGNPPTAASISNLAQTNRKLCSSLAKSTIESDENHGETKLVNSETSANTSGNELYAQQKPFGRLENTEEGLDWPLSVDDKAVDVPISKESRNIRGVDLYAPDTLDVMEDGQANSLTITQDKSSSAKEEQNVTHDVVCEGSVSSLHQEENTTSNSNGGYEKSDSDSPGQDITKSMMTLLLPQAIPLLRKSRRKNEKPTSTLKDLHPSQKFHEENYKTGSNLDVQSPGKEHHVDQSSVHSKSIIPDTFDDLCGDIATNELIFPSEHAETYKSSSDKDDSKQDFDSVNGKNLSIDMSHHVKEQLPMNKTPQGIGSYLPEAMLGPPSPGMSISHKESEDAGTKTDTAEGLKSKPDGNEAAAPCDSARMPILNSVQSSSTANTSEAGATQIGNPSTSVPKKFYARKKGLRAESTTQKSESLCCRKVANVCGPKSTGVSTNLSASLIPPSVGNADDAGMEGKFHGVSTEKIVIDSNSNLDSTGPIMSETEPLILASEVKDSSHFVQFSVDKVQGYCHDRLVAHNNDPVSAQKQEILSCTNGMSDAIKSQFNSEPKLNRNLEIDNELKGSFGLIGCYVHPIPVSSLLSIVKGTEIFICVVCGHLGDKERTLFLYKLSIEEPRIGHPSFVGHVSITWPSSIDTFGREIVLERCGYQLTPDGHRVVLLGNIRTPYCREGRIDCLCPTCSSECLEHNTVKIVQINTGYVSVLVKVRTIDSLQCLLVCEPNHLVAAGESGRLHLWTMDPTWSSTTEEFVISTKDYISTSIVDLKRMPQCASLVVGHNGFGDFTVWDLLKRRVMSRFSSPGTSVHQFFPISLFSWKKEFSGLSYSNMEEYVNKFTNVKKLWSSETVGNHSNMQLEGEDNAVCILMSGSDFDIQHQNLSRDVEINPFGCWRLGLLVRNMLILGCKLDTRATAACSSLSHGIIGTLDGQVYAWNLLTGCKLGNIHHFKGGSVSCIAADDSKSGIFAVADDTGQLLVYRCLENVADC